MRFLSLFLISIFFSSTAFSETVRLTVAEEIYKANLEWANLLPKAFELAGHELEIVPLPGKRALDQANQGNYHGDAFRGMFIQPIAPDLIPISVPIDHFDLYAWSIHADDVQSFAQLNELKVVGMSGFRYFDHLSHVITQDILTVNDIETVQNMLENRDNIFFVGSPHYRKGLAQSHRVDSSRWTLIYPKPLKSFSVHSFIHKKHEHLIPDLEIAFQQVFKNVKH